MSPTSPFAALANAISDFMRRQAADLALKNGPGQDGAAQQAEIDETALLEPNAVILGRDRYMELRAHRDALRYFELGRNPGDPDKVMGLHVVRAYDRLDDLQVAYVPGWSR